MMRPRTFTQVPTCLVTLDNCVFSAGVKILNERFLKAGIHVLVVYKRRSYQVESAPRVYILNEAVCIPPSTNTLGKGINPTIPSSAMGTLKGRLGSLSLVSQPV